MAADPCMYIFINADAGMSRGKIAAQAAHAAVEAYRLMDPNSSLLRLWYAGGHYKKIVLRADNSEHLRTIERYLNDRGFKTALIIDEGMTEVEPLTPTALGVEVVDKNAMHTQQTFSAFTPLREEGRPVENERKAPKWRRCLTEFLNRTRDRNQES